MDKSQIIENTKKFVEIFFKSSETAHDYFHAIRVWRMAKLLSKDYPNADLFVIEVTALVHDIVDRKINNENLGINTIVRFLEKEGVKKNIIDEVVFLSRKISFSAEDFENKSIELQILQDADKLDAIGAIGVARAFNFGGYKKRIMFDPLIKPKLNLSKEEYKKHISTTINHFYEKLLLLKDLMNTSKAKEIAEKRHNFMEKFLEQFFVEWNLDDF